MDTQTSQATFTWWDYFAFSIAGAHFIAAIILGAKGWNQESQWELGVMFVWIIWAIVATSYAVVVSIFSWGRIFTLDIVILAGCLANSYYAFAISAPSDFFSTQTALLVSLRTPFSVPLLIAYLALGSYIYFKTKKAKLPTFTLVARLVAATVFLVILLTKAAL